MGFTIPDRVGNSMTGSQFGSSILHNVGQVREDAILQQLELGNIPDFMRAPVELTVLTADHELLLYTLPDYFCIGDDSDFLRMPMFPKTAQIIADKFNAMLPTKALVDLVWKSSTTLSPQPLPPSAHMASTETFIAHNNKIEQKRGGVSGLVAGHKKDIVITPKLTKGKVAIYGWHYQNGTPIQPLNPWSHSDTYVDYSHGTRLICLDAILNDQPIRLDDLLQDPALSKLISDEGPSKVVRYV